MAGVAEDEGLKAAIDTVLSATWQRCLVHFMRNVLAHAGNQGRRVVSAFIGTAFAQETATAAHAQWRQVADQLRPRAHKLADLMDTAEMDVLAYMDFPQAHLAKLHSTNPIVRLNDEIRNPARKPCWRWPGVGHADAPRVPACRGRSPGRAECQGVE